MGGHKRVAKTPNGLDLVDTHGNTELTTISLNDVGKRLSLTQFTMDGLIVKIVCSPEDIQMAASSMTSPER